MRAVGVDIGGTKSAVCLGEVSEDQAHILYKCIPRKTKTYSAQEMLDSKEEPLFEFLFEEFWIVALAAALSDSISTPSYSTPWGRLEKSILPSVSGIV